MGGLVSFVYSGENNMNSYPSTIQALHDQLVYGSKFSTTDKDGKSNEYDCFTLEEWWPYLEDHWEYIRQRADIETGYDFWVAERLAQFAIDGLGLTISTTIRCIQGSGQSFWMNYLANGQFMFYTQKTTTYKYLTYHEYAITTTYIRDKIGDKFTRANQTFTDNRTQTTFSFIAFEAPDKTGTKLKNRITGWIVGAGGGSGGGGEDPGGGGEEPDDPDNPGGGQGGTGGGVVAPERANIDRPEPPLFDPASIGLLHIYLPTGDQLNDLSDFLWSKSLVDVISKFFSNPLDSILSLGVTYATPRSTQLTDKIVVGPTYLTYGEGEFRFFVANDQFATIDCGELEIPSLFENALDFEPYTQISAYLPYVGEVNWSAKDVVGKTISVYYSVDLLSGQSMCVVYAVSGTDFKMPIYMYDCNLMMQYPLSGADFSRVYSAFAGVVAAGATGAVASFAGATPLSSSVAQVRDEVASAVGQAYTGQNIPVFHSGSYKGVVGIMGPRKPHVIIRRLNPYMPGDYEEFQGLPSNAKVKLQDISGFTRVREVHVTGVPATDQEIDMIESLLKGGVII